MSFYVTCNSSVTPFLQYIDLSGYELSVVDVFVPTKVLMDALDYSFTSSRKSDGVTVEGQIKPINLRSVHSVVIALEEALEGIASVNITDRGYLILTCQDDVNLTMSNSLAKVLGFTDQTFVGLVQATRPVVVELLQDWITVQANLVYPYPVHGRYRPVVYQGPPVIHAGYPLYHLTIPTVFNGLYITIHDFEGNKLSLDNGSYSLTFHFQKRNTTDN